MKAPHAADASALLPLPGHSGVPHVFVVEDEPDIAAVLADYLRAQVGTVSCFADGETALAAIRSPAPGQPRPDLVLLDVMLPGLDGLAVLRAVRATLDVPVVLVTARVEELDRLLGLDLGADDYICKPFSPREVVARVKAVLRRAWRPRAGGATNGAPGAMALSFDMASRQARLHGIALNLTPKELALLRTLARQPGRIFSRGQLLDLAYADDLDASERAVDSHIKNLRRKLAEAQGQTRTDGRQEWIRSVYGVGFVFEPDA